MQKLYDAMVAVPMAILVMMEWTGSPLRMLLLGAALLAIMAVGAYLGGYILGTERHWQATRRQRVSHAEEPTNPCYYCLSSQGGDCQDTCEAYQNYLSMLDQYCKGGDKGNVSCKTSRCPGVAAEHIS